jgi:uncharacterized membrane protein YeiH
VTINRSIGHPVRTIRSEPLLFQPGQFYVMASLIGVSADAGLKAWLNVPAVVADWVAIRVTFLFRTLSIVFNWKTAPILPEPSPPPSEEVRDS